MCMAGNLVLGVASLSPGWWWWVRSRLCGACLWSRSATTTLRDAQFPMQIEVTAAGGGGGGGGGGDGGGGDGGGEGAVV